MIPSRSLFSRDFARIRRISSATVSGSSDRQLRLAIQDAVELGHLVLLLGQGSRAIPTGREVGDQAVDAVDVYRLAEQVTLN